MNRRQMLLSTGRVFAARDTFAQTPTQPATGGNGIEGLHTQHHTTKCLLT
ncbi:MAG: hypothetical protein M3Y27_04915 [Acidobacteriota bacterium]|nr:hypothetical protein [Acidobacteriota bacterium]